jgi:DNA-binding XRE family transcriptional regulator
MRHQWYVTHCARSDDVSGMKTAPAPALAGTLPAVIRRLRLARELTQEALAAEAGLDRTFVSAVERGRRNISVATLDRLIAPLCSPESFLHEWVKELSRGK